MNADRMKRVGEEAQMWMTHFPYLPRCQGACGEKRLEPTVTTAPDLRM